MKTATYRRVNGRGLARAAAFGLFALACVLCQSREARAQWTTSGANTSTTNNVGIGAVPQNLEGWARVLDVYGSPHAKFSIRTPNIDARIQAHEYGYWGSSPGMVIGLRTNHAISFGTNETIRMVIGNTGNVGIGTTAPAERLDVRGNVVFESGGNPNLYTGTGTAELNRYLYVLNSPGLTSASGLKAGGVLVSDDYGYANPAKNDLVVKGNVGVGTSAPQAKLDVAGDIRVSGNINAKYQDVAEWVPSTQKLSAGTVVVLDTKNVNHVTASHTAYDTRVAGVVSAQPGITLGEAGEGKALVATTGRVKVRVDATRAPIQIGDLIVTSDVEGVGMKSEPLQLGGRQFHAPGTIIGKALEPLEKGAGEILVLLSLQ